MRNTSLYLVLIVAAAICVPMPVSANEPLVVAQAEPDAAPADPAGPTKPAPATPKPSSGIEEIVIRAGESESVADYEAADSVTGFDAADLEALGAQTVEDLATFTPNLEIVTSGSTTPTFFIRGVGLNDFNANSTGAVALYHDDVPVNAPALQLGTLFDMEAVNVLRGPQGTGLARNASAGAIKLYTRKPTGEYGSYVRGSYGNYDYLDVEGALEAPIHSDVLSSRFAFRLTQRDGYLTNRCSGPEDDRGFRCGEQFAFTVPDGLPNKVNNLNNWAARGTLRFQPTLDMDWLIGAHGSRRNEDSRLGQTIGAGNFRCIDQRTGGAIPPRRCVTGFPARDGQRSPRLYGGPDREGYVDPDIRGMRDRAVQALIAKHCTPGDRPCEQAATQVAKDVVAKQLGESLDSDPYAGDYNLVGPTQNDTWGTYLRGDIVLPKGITMTSITGYDTYDRRIIVDLDQSPNQLFHFDTADTGWQTTQDLKFAGSFTENLPLTWEFGGYFLMENLEVFQDLNLFPGAIGAPEFRDYVQRIWSGGAYANLTWDFSENFTLDGGFRWNLERKTMDIDVIKDGVANPYFLDNTWQAPTGMVRLTYRFREDTHVFWKYTRGWKPGHYNATATPFRPPDVADPETINAFETGVRGSWLEGRLGLDFSLFYYDYDDYQLFTVRVLANENPEFVIINASDAEVYGAEADVVMRPWAGSFLNVRFSWLESRFIDFVQQQFLEQNFGLDFISFTADINNTGNRLLNSPQFKVSMTAEQAIPLGRWGTLTGRYDVVWTDTTFFDGTEGRGIPNEDGDIWMPENAIAQPAYWLHNIWFGYRPPIGNVEIAGWCRNLTDEVYRTFSFDASNFTNTTIHLLGLPRTYGVTVSVGF